MKIIPFSTEDLRMVISGLKTRSHHALTMYEAERYLSGSRGPELWKRFGDVGKLSLAGEYVARAGCKLVYLADFVDGDPKRWKGRRAVAEECRFSLMVESIEVLSLHDLTPEMAIEDGLQCLPNGRWLNYKPGYMWDGEFTSRYEFGYEDPVKSFRSKWARSERKCDSNLLVFSIKFHLLT